MADRQIILSRAVWPDDRAIVQALFRDYAGSLAVDLCFQNFEDELANLPGKYDQPGGVVLLARVDQAAAAVGCYRPIDQGCEMKRLYVRPEFRGLGLGRRMAVHLIENARAAGHEFMVLDSLASMVEAQALYRSLGFRNVEPYYDNPLAGTVYMRLDL